MYIFLFQSFQPIEQELCTKVVINTNMSVRMSKYLPLFPLTREYLESQDLKIFNGLIFTYITNCFIGKIEKM